jgi:hypothetical protein
MSLWLLKCRSELQLDADPNCRMGGELVLCVGHSAGIVLAELSLHNCLEPFLALAPLKYLKIGRLAS